MKWGECWKKNGVLFAKKEHKEEIMKKRVLAVIFAAMMAFGVAGCGGADEHEGHDHSQQAEELVDDAEEIDAETEALVETMKAELSVYADYLPPEEAAAAGLYTITGEGVVGGQEDFDAFMAGEAESVILCQYTQRGGVVLDYLMQRDNGMYLILSDSTRDGYADDEKVGEDYEVMEFAALKVFEDFKVQEDSNPVTIGVLTNETDLTADDFRTYWNEGTTGSHQAYLLYVI